MGFLKMAKRDLTFRYPDLGHRGEDQVLRQGLGFARITNSLHTREFLPRNSVVGDAFGGKSE